MDALERRQHLFGPERRQGWRGGLGRAAVAVVAVGLLSLAPGLAPAQTAAIVPDQGLSAAAPLVEQEIQAGRVPGAVVLMGQGGRTVYRAAFGSRSLAEDRAPLAADDIFDLASVTKVVATTTAVMQLVEQGRIDLDRPVADYWPAFAANGKAAITVRQLLTHTSGLPADLDLAGDWRGQEAGLALVAAARPIRPPGAAFRYSDVNFIALGEVVRQVSGEPLEVYAQRHVFGPLGMVDTGFSPPPAKLDRVVATDREDGQLRWGQVQDPTAYRMGGVAGHAGLFSTADDLARFARMLLNGGELDGARILKPETVALMTEPAMLPGGVRRGLGWDVASPYSGGMDVAFGPGGFGHTGYTGCAIWIDPPTGGYLIVLTSRLDPDGKGDAKPLRRELARILAQAAGANRAFEVGAAESAARTR
jgi:CubicO group peptidase (beta-lactamase class C family)